MRTTFIPETSWNMQVQWHQRSCSVPDMLSRWTGGIMKGNLVKSGCMED